jgi:hypothetical protein
MVKTALHLARSARPNRMPLIAQFASSGDLGRPHEIDRSRDRLRPEGDRSHRILDLRMIVDKAVLFDKITGEFDETVGITVTMKDRSEHGTPGTIRVRGSAICPVLHADLHLAAREQAP